MARRTLADHSDGKTARGSVLQAPWPYLLAGLILIAVAALMQFGGNANRQEAKQIQADADNLVQQIARTASDLRDLLNDEELQAAALEVIQGERQGSSLLPIARVKLAEVTDVHVYGPDVFMSDLSNMGEGGFIMLDMMIEALRNGLSRAQRLTDNGVEFMAAAAPIGRAARDQGFVIVYVDPSFILDQPRRNELSATHLVLEHSAGGNAPVKLRTFGESLPPGATLMRLPVPGTLLRVAFPMVSSEVILETRERILLFALGGVLLLIGGWRYLATRDRVEPTQTMPERFTTYHEPPPPADESPQPDTPLPPPPPPPPDDAPSPQRLPEEEHHTEVAFPDRADVLSTLTNLDDGDPSLPAFEEIEVEPLTHEGSTDDDRFTLSNLPRKVQERAPMTAPVAEPVELTGDIFRAYDIRGIVGKTLDRGVAVQIGQAVGSLALDSMAPPLVVGRDGRHSGPELVAGLVEGIASTGCAVIDVGAVPTGALYYSCYEFGEGSGVMVTGSHNPPDYNGFKIMIGGRTLSGDAIYGLFDRIQSGNIRKGEGTIETREVLQSYLKRIAGDIQLERPLKVVADCGNGIAGICAAAILRGIGAEVIPLFEEVDGTFPNHHPDPSEPENLRDLIESVRLMDADLGVAFDGDADRLGVVTPNGEIVFADRIMMLYVREILSRNPGARIIYDVKCTGHLNEVIEAAGGDPEMYKTGHSLIKNRMKEVDAPFAGEMSGHFFFQDRWYGFDCGIYAAARLLEILAMEKGSAEEVLSALPNSISTPELKVHMNEGENHAFIEEFQAKADFPGARLTTIDGVRADYPDGWGLVRASNTTPILVLRFDADSQASLTTVQEAFRAQLLALRPDMVLPF